MSKGMLGMLPLSDVQGVINDIQAKLASDEGSTYLAELKKFARKELCWAPHFIRAVDFDPATFIGAGWKWADEIGDHNSLALSEVDFSRLLFETCLKEGESLITGKEKLGRLKSADNIRLDPRFAIALFKEKGHKTLECLYKERGITYLEFFGMLLMNPNGARHVFYLYRDGGRWGWDTNALARWWHDGNLSVGLAR